MGDFTRGSEWRRWDLHLHTPDTKKNDNYSGHTSEEKWNQFYTDIENYIGTGSIPEKNVVVIGVTDYLSTDNYERVVDDHRLPASVKLVLPNVEMRVLPTAADSPVNIHFIFDPEIVSSLESRFFSRLTFEYDHSNFSATKAELIRLGKKKKPDADDAKAYKEGLNQFVPGLDSVKKIFEDQDLRKHTIIGISNNSSDGASGITEHCSYFENGESQLTLARQAAYQFADFIFSGNNSDRHYFLGEKVDSPNDVIRKCGSLMPCLHGCDAHENSKIFEPDDKKYCWIKADPTFNGLRQVLYEPKERVRISPLLPEPKTDYHVIRSVRICDPKFSPEPILFNDKLSCIIGGKSTGKSILLYNIARAIDPNQVQTKLEETGANILALDNITVEWADGTTNSTDAPGSEHKVVYIPQTYLNRLSDKKEETTEIDNIIELIVLQNSDSKAAYEKLKKQLSDLKPIIDKQIYDVIAAQDERQKLEEDKKEIGSQNGLEKQIEKIKQQIEDNSNDPDLSEEEITRYHTTVSALQIFTKKEQQLDSLTEMVSGSQITVKVVPEALFSQGNDAFKELLQAAYGTVNKAATEVWETQKKTLLGYLEEQIEANSEAIRNNESIRDSLKDKIISSETLSRLTKQLNDEEAKLRSVKEIEKQIAAKDQQIDGIIDQLASSFQQYHSFYNEYCRVGDQAGLDEELEFYVTASFRENAFCDQLRAIFDNRTLKARKDIIDLEDFHYSCFGQDQLKKLLLECLRGNLPIVKNTSVENALRGILADWFNISYNAKMDGDMIEEMSPGKKALVLLRLLISLAESKSPILIDQPEDDLDNRSITDDLIQFIKEKKIERQIIVVTHNANVVLGGDAEEVIVANQRGKNAPNQEYQFEYRSGSIEENRAAFDNDGNMLSGILNSQGISKHICDILEGGKAAFDLRRNKYRLN